MMFYLFAFSVTVAFFVSSLSLLHFGRLLGLRYLKRHNAIDMPGLPTIEGAVFALIGLLLAFTISGALLRFDERRQLIVQEANAISTAYDRLALFEGQAVDLRSKLKDYTKARIDLYQKPHDFSFWQHSEIWSSEQQTKIQVTKDRLWDATVAACPQSNFRPACPQAIAALTTVFETARVRTGTTEKHPPQVVYGMLFALGLGGSLLAGFGMATAPARSWIHMILFAATLSVTLYVVTDMEYPRFGFIQVTGFDHFLVEVYNHMGVSGS